MGTKRKIDLMVRRIVSRFAPERIILFGSHATGTATADSDVDLLIVMPVAGSKRQKAIEVGVALADFDLSKDIVISTPNAFSWRKDVPGTIEYPATREGIVLYDRT